MLTFTLFYKAGGLPEAGAEEVEETALAPAKVSPDLCKLAAATPPFTSALRVQSKNTEDGSITDGCGSRLLLNFLEAIISWWYPAAV